MVMLLDDLERTVKWFVRCVPGVYGDEEREWRVQRWEDVEGVYQRRYQYNLGRSKPASR
jgi:hypothetical protein